MNFVLIGIAELILFAAAALTLVRLVRGPSAFDRLVAGDTMLLILIGFLLAESTLQPGRTYIDAALALALFSFVGTVFLARFLGDGEIDE